MIGTRGPEENRPERSLGWGSRRGRNGEHQRDRRPHGTAEQRLGRLAAVAGAVLLLAASGPGGAAAQQPGEEGDLIVLPARQVLTDLRPGRAYNQPQLAIDPTDERTLVIAGANYNAVSA